MLIHQWPDLVAVPRRVLVFDGDAASAEEALAVLAIGPSWTHAHGTLHLYRHVLKTDGSVRVSSALQSIECSRGGGSS